MLSKRYKSAEVDKILRKSFVKMFILNINNWTISPMH